MQHTKHHNTRYAFIAVIVAALVFVSAVKVPVGDVCQGQQEGARTENPTLIQLDVQRADIQDVLGLLSRQSGMNIVFGDDVRGHVSATLYDVTLEEALKAVVSANKFYWRKEGNVYIVTTTPPPVPAAPVERPGPPAEDTRVKPKSVTPNEFVIPPLGPAVAEDVPPADEGIKEKPKYAVIPLKYVDARSVVKMFDYNAPPGFLGPGALTSTIFPSGPTVGIPNWGGTSSRAPNLLEKPGGSRFGAGFGTQGIGGVAQFGGLGGGGLGGGGLGGGGLGGGLGGGAGRQGGIGGGGVGGGLSVPEGMESIISYDPQNWLILYGTSEAINQLKEIIAFLDVPIKQVTIEAQFVEIVTNLDKRLGITWNFTHGPFEVRNDATGTGGSIQVKWSKGDFSAQLQTLFNENKAKAINSPRVTTMNNSPATLQVATNFPFFVQTPVYDQFGNPSVSTSVEYISVQTAIQVIPTINADGTVTVYLIPQISDITGFASGPRGEQVPIVVQRTVQTVLNVKDGETIVMGGLVRKSLTNNVNRVPLLSELPVVGKLFRSNIKAVNDSEVLIFLTPRVIHTEMESSM